MDSPDVLNRRNEAPIPAADRLSRFTLTNVPRGNISVKLADLRRSAGRATSLLKAMSNTSRLLILCQLAEGEKSVGELESAIGLSQSGLSQHLAVLRRKGIISRRRQAQFIFYSLTSTEAQAVMATLYQVFCTKVAPKRPVPLREKLA
jgi:DNA-binding transcriptional ArsR family regulator